MLFRTKMIAKCLFSPRLYTIYRGANAETIYQPNAWETWGDKIIFSVSTILKIGLYTSPIICFYLYRRGYFASDEYKMLANLFGGVTCILVFSFLMRAYGRANNPVYKQFLRTIDGANKNSPTEYLDGVRRYDFDFSAWPASFDLTPQRYLNRFNWLVQNPFSTCANEDLPVFQRYAIQLLAFGAVHTFGLRLIYPGCMGLIHNIFWGPLLMGRTQLVQEYNGQRAKIITADRNAIDTMFVDKRRSSHFGNTLVICCEGNSGFYEVGILTIPVRAGYSALGWNHPGFGESTGLPYPSQEHNALDAVIQYAIEQLGFKPENIVMFGWSIGGYSAAWAAAHYPVKGVVLDATFDDLLPLAKNHMPRSWSRLVQEVVRTHVDLHVAELLKQYSGPVYIVRRTEDEIICLNQGEPSSNRGNHLVVELIKHRHENVREHVDDLKRYANMLAVQRPKPDSALLNDGQRLVLTLLYKYMRDYKSSHCTPLPDQHFNTLMQLIENSTNAKNTPIA